MKRLELIGWILIVWGFVVFTLGQLLMWGVI